MPARRDTQMEASRLRFLSPLQTVEDQSLVWGIRCHSCTGREGLPPSWKLSYKAFGFAIYPRTSVLFRSTGRTELQPLFCHSPAGHAPSGLGRPPDIAPTPRRAGWQCALPACCGLLESLPWRIAHVCGIAVSYTHLRAHETPEH